MPDYQPGVCNIGPVEIRGRHRAGYYGIVFTVLWLGVLLVFRFPSLWRLTLFLPVTSTATGFLQAYYHFCANYGLRGLFNVAKSLGQTDTVQQAEFRKLDKRRSLMIIGQSALIGAVVAVVAYLL